VAAQGLYSLKLKPRNYQAWVHSDQMVLVIPRREAGPAAWWSRRSSESWKTTLDSQEPNRKETEWQA
jgi:hypothetical protein